MIGKVSNCYPLDNSAIIHLASMSKEYTNSFRIAATLTETVCPEILQSALDHVTPRFPTIIAGVRQRLFQYVVVPAEAPPQVQPEQECLSHMTKDRIETCAVRILYAENVIAFECFHALTDGYGGIVFLNTLLAEYFSLKYSVCCVFSEQTINPHSMIMGTELVDDYLTYSGTHKISANNRKVYRLPDSAILDDSVHVTTGIYQMQELLDAAHHFGVSLTVFLTAVMFDAVMEIQRNHIKDRNLYEPVQIMVPVNLRKRFASKTLRNFSLYALPCIEPTSEKISFESLICQISEQMQEQTSKKYLLSMITTNVQSQKLPLFCILPLPVKNAILRLVYHFYGERNSCLSISNLGEITCPEEIKQYIQQVDFSLTPRRNTANNCGIVSYGGKLFINFTRRGEAMELEQCFFGKLAGMGYYAKIE